MQVFFLIDTVGFRERGGVGEVYGGVFEGAGKGDDGGVVEGRHFDGKGLRVVW